MELNKEQTLEVLALALKSQDLGAINVERILEQAGRYIDGDGSALDVIKELEDSLTFVIVDTILEFKDPEDLLDKFNYTLNQIKAATYTVGDFCNKF